MDSNNCIMLRAHRTPSQKELNLRYKSLVDHYIGVIKHYHKELLKMSNGKHKLFFSNDTSLTGGEVLKCYRTRFQIESCFRDAKLFTGLADCQARNPWKLDFAYNLTFAALNVAKVMMKDIGMGYSMASFKMLTFNTYLVHRIFKANGYRPNRTLISKVFKDLVGLQRRAS